MGARDQKEVFGKETRRVSLSFPSTPMTTEDPAELSTVYGAIFKDILLLRKETAIFKSNYSNTIFPEVYALTTLM